MAKGRDFFSRLDPNLVCTEYSQATSMYDLLIRLGSREAGANREQLRALLGRLGLDAEALVRKGIKHAALKLKTPTKPEDHEVLVEGSRVQRGYLKSFILKKGLLKYQCEKCGLGPEWQGHSLTLVLDHINGVYNDHRLENLRFLCPNCNAQTDTFAGANVKRRNGEQRTVKVTHDTCECGSRKLIVSSRCTTCAVPFNSANLPVRSKIPWPPLETLVCRLRDTPVCTLAQELGVSGVALKKHLSKRGVQTPGRGYWAKVRSGHPDHTQIG